MFHYIYYLYGIDNEEGLYCIYKKKPVTDLDKAIYECKFNSVSPYETPNGYSVGEDYQYMLAQLRNLKLSQNSK